MALGSGLDGGGGSDVLEPELRRMRALLQEALASRGERSNAAVAASDGCAGSSLERLARVFRLSAFERDLVLLACSVEIDRECGKLVGALEGMTLPTRPSLGLAL